MSNELVRYEAHSPAVILTMNRPDRRNALSRGLIDALVQAFRRARDDEAARCVILTGAGNAFCAGMDLAELQESLAAGSGPPPIPPPEGGGGGGGWGGAPRVGQLYDIN
jgi:enoyl-CoA hydratase/carnithine racemase